MKKILFTLSTFCLVLLGCASLPHSAVHKENIVLKPEALKADNSSEAVYSIDYCFAEKEKNDFVSFTIKTLLDEYRLDFYTNGNIKDILHTFFKIDDPDSEGHKKNGESDLGSTMLYCYAVSEDHYIRLDVMGKKQDFVDFSLISKNGVKALTLNRFSIKTMKGKSDINGYVEPVSFSYADIKKLYDFMGDKDNLEKLRAEAVQLKQEEAAKAKAPPVRAEEE